MNDQDKNIKKFLRAVERRLRFPRDVRGRVMSDFSSSISARREAGESVEEILNSLGSPKQAAAELNEQMREYTYVKSPWRFAFLGAAVGGGLYLLGEVVSMSLVYLITGSEAASIGVIGGADGPTAIFLTSCVDTPTAEMKILLSVIALAAGIFGFYKFSRRRRK